MIFMQVSGQMALQYGAPNAILANLCATIATALLAIAFAYSSTTTALNSSLMARGCGYGFVGTALTSVIYASNFIVLALRIRPPHIEFGQEAVRAWNPVGPFALAGESIVSGCLALAATEPMLVVAA